MSDGVFFLSELQAFVEIVDIEGSGKILDAKDQSETRSQLCKASLIPR